MITEGKLALVVMSRVGWTLGLREVLILALAIGDTTCTKEVQRVDMAG